jgi:hypothetical protein
MNGEKKETDTYNEKEEEKKAKKREPLKKDSVNTLTGLL